MIQELRNPFGRVYLTINTNTKNRWVHVNWMGYLTEENIKTGAAAYTEALANAGYSCVLNDTRLLIGSWDHSMDWVVKEWAPWAARAGLKHFAMVTTPETFGGSSAEKFFSSLKAFEVRVFEDMGKAQEWLQQYALDK
ncbi:STAS/SEC14 domain-containing protein [Pontibacter flavimaris]|uniref:STAS/SEC14 domain-containing protein n=1 Tax=Pontibacter flavimaris TaxID=1797110 RepID=A0A1Q5PDN2_9BACT|nr:STAS/SEC14 domain-containing protein [Pontibacter flavimaris]OKL40359.1 hypothetical protein A3841_18750 [Pontibacter flavimaris]